MTHTHIGAHGLYRAAESHHTTTFRKGSDEIEAEGSVHHPRMRSFFATVGRVHEGGTVDVAILVPGSGNLHWVEGVKVGAGLGEFDPDGHKPAEPAPQELKN